MSEVEKLLQLEIRYLQATPTSTSQQKVGDSTGIVRLPLRFFQVGHRVLDFPTILSLRRMQG